MIIFEYIDKKMKNSKSKMKNNQRKPTKTISGVAPLAVMLPPRKCNHGTCLYCPTLNAPQSYTPKSPAVLRASALDYDAYKQVRARLKSFQVMKHPVDKIELIIMGGTFLDYPEEFQEKFILDCYNALNGKKSKTIEEAKKINEKCRHRCVALCIETRPDVCGGGHIKKMLGWGATRVELGVQIPDDKIYNLVNRGHTIKDVVDATKRLRKAGFKIGYHIMPGLPGSSLKKDLKMFRKLFSDKRFKPDQVKIYPCQVLKESKLEEWYYQGKYVPYTKEEIFKLLIRIIKMIPEYCRAMRIMREIPPSFLIAGTTKIDLRKDVEEYIRKKKIRIKEIRFREIGFVLRDNREIDKKVKIRKIEYRAGDAKEVFLEAVNKENILFALLRLSLGEEAIIRELHVYGPALRLGESGTISQHRGLGRELLERAEKIAGDNRYRKIKIISGVGAREYYRKFGYKLDEKMVYMEKYLGI